MARMLSRAALYRGAIVRRRVRTRWLLSGDEAALASIHLQAFAGSLESARATTPSGKPVPLAVHGGRLTPRVRLTPGERIDVEVVVRRPGALSWALGDTRRGWTVPPPSTLRLEQLLAQGGYLPLDWQPFGDDVPRTRAAQASASVDAPGGTFTWRFTNTPAELKREWKIGEANEIVRGAIMRFQDTHHLEVDAFAGPAVSRARPACPPRRPSWAPSPSSSTSPARR